MRLANVTLMSQADFMIARDSSTGSGIQSAMYILFLMTDGTDRRNDIRLPRTL